MFFGINLSMRPYSPGVGISPSQTIWDTTYASADSWTTPYTATWNTPYSTSV